MKSDHIEHIIDQWNQVYPGHDYSPMALIGRMTRISRIIEKALHDNFKRFQLHSGEFDVLATIYRNNLPEGLTPTQLYQSSMLSSGAMTSRLDRLEKKGLIHRLPDPQDRRGLRVKLTEKGTALLLEVLESHLAVETALLAGLKQEEKTVLEISLSEWLKVLQNPTAE